MQHVLELFLPLPVVVTLINCLSVRLATMVQNVFTFCKMLAILLIVLGGLYKLLDGKNQTVLVFCYKNNRLFFRECQQPVLLVHIHQTRGRQPCLSVLLWPLGLRRVEQFELRH